MGPFQQKTEIVDRKETKSKIKKNQKRLGEPSAEGRARRAKSSRRGEDGERSQKR